MQYSQLPPQGTWYEVGLGACGYTDSDSDYVVAISHDIYGSGGNCNQVPVNIIGANGILMDSCHPNNAACCTSEENVSRNNPLTTIKDADVCDRVLPTSLATRSALKRIEGVHLGGNKNTYFGARAGVEAG